MTGIDISEFQLAIPAGAWDFVITRVTHDRAGVDKRVARHFPAAAKFAHRGVYHFWDPTASSGAAQAAHMAQTVLALGFRKGVDLWALDAEAKALPTHAQNTAWAREFFATGRALLGGKCLFYVGYPFYVANFGNDPALLHEHAWWLPAYGPNDGQPHEPACPFAPTLHQYTSRGGPGGSGLDVSRVMDAAAWNALVGGGNPTPPAQKPHPTQPQPKVKPVIDTKSPLRDVKSFVDPKSKRVVPIALTHDGGVFSPSPGVGFEPFTPIGHDYWKGQVAAALAVAGDPNHPLTQDEIRAGNVYAVIAESGARYAYGPKN